MAISFAEATRTLLSGKLLSDEVEARLLERLGIPAEEQAENAEPTAPDAHPTFALPRLRLAPGEWQSGDNLWLIDLASPFGGAAEAAQQLRDQTFEDRAVKTVRQSADSAGFEVGAWTA